MTHTAPPSRHRLPPAPAVLVSLAALGLLGGCAAASASSPDASAMAQPVERSERDPAAAVLAADRSMAEAVDRGDVAAFADRVAEDAVFHGVPVLRGRMEVVEGWRPLMRADRGTLLTWVPERAVVAASGDLAYTTGRFTITRTAGDRAAEGGVYVTVWRRDEDGRWRAVVDSGSPPQPLHR